MDKKLPDKFSKRFADDQQSQAVKMPLLRWALRNLPATIYIEKAQFRVFG